jgi:hypothetical protein
MPARALLQGPDGRGPGRNLTGRAAPAMSGDSAAINTARRSMTTRRTPGRMPPRRSPSHHRLLQAPGRVPHPARFPGTPARHADLRGDRGLGQIHPEEDQFPGPPVRPLRRLRSQISSDNAPRRRRARREDRPQPGGTTKRAPRPQPGPGTRADPRGAGFHHECDHAYYQHAILSSSCSCWRSACSA